MAVDVSSVRARRGAYQTYSGFYAEAAGPSAVRHPILALGDRWLSLLLPAVLVLVIAALNDYAVQQFRSGNAAIAQENGFLENVQLLVTLPAIVLFAFAGVRGLGAVRVSGVALALIVAAVFVREVDFKSFIGAHAALDWLIAKGLRNWIMVLLGVALVPYLLAHLRYFWGLVRLGLRWQAWPCAASVALLALAEFYLDGLTGASAHLWEELAETNGYILFALAAWKHVQLIGHPELDAPVMRRRRIKAAAAEAVAA